MPNMLDQGNSGTRLYYLKNELPEPIKLRDVASCDVKITHVNISAEKCCSGRLENITLLN
jgi:hypothetical protein